MSSRRVEEEYRQILAYNSWPQVYQNISQRASQFVFPFTEAKKQENKRLNRYRDVSPYDHSRVVLHRCGLNYINANLVQYERANRRYILTQGPLIATVDHFWSMVWEQKTQGIIMLNKVIEKTELKCHWYWPAKNNKDFNLVLEKVNLAVKQIEEEDHEYYTTRVFRVTDLETEESRFVTHFHYTTWPDFEVPSSPVAFLDFLERVRESGVLGIDVGPAIVHCSAGIGRSGTFCLVDVALLLIEQEGQADVDIPDILVQLRRYRMGLIQTVEQLRFSYQAIMEGIRRLNPEYSDALDTNYYSVVAEEEEAPPPPPPRGESLGQPPARPLPAIPSSISLGDINVSNAADSSGSEEETSPCPAPSSRGTPSPISSVSSDSDDDEEEKKLADNSNNAAAEARREARRLKQRKIAERVAAMRKRALAFDRQNFKRSLFTPIAISVGFVFAGIIIYYVKH